VHADLTSQKLERLSREDAARWHMGTPENQMVIGALLIFDHGLTLEALDELVRRKILPHRRFLQHVVEPARWFGRPCWRDESAFELRAHVRHLNPSKGVDAAALVRLAGERMSAPLPLDRSPWSLELVDLAPAGSALLVRIHHCIADGRALVSLLAELADGTYSASEGRSPGPPSPRSDRRGSFFGRLAGLFRFLTLSGDSVSLLRHPLGGHKRIAWSESIALDSVKSIAQERGHRVTDVLLAGVAGALDRYARNHGQAPRSIRALMPVAAPSESSSDGLGNHYASVFVRLPIAGTDPQARLEAIARDTAALRTRGELRMAIGLTRLAGAVAPAIEHWAVRWWSRRASLVVSSLAGPIAPLRMAGHQLRSIVVWAPAPASVGLSLTFFGHAGSLHLGVLADAAVVDRPEELVAAFQDAMDELSRGARADTR
jgi:diacylglycerol O-acyltransferase